MEERNWCALLSDEGGLQQYLSTMGRNGTWGDGLILEVASVIYKRPIIIVLSNTEVGDQTGRQIHIGPESNHSPIILGYCRTGEKVDLNRKRNHYVSLISAEEHTNAESTIKGLITSKFYYFKFDFTVTVSFTGPKVRKQYHLLCCNGLKLA